MAKQELVKIFEERKVRSVWDEEQEKWYFSVVDVVGALTDQPDLEHSRNYWKVLKHRLKKEGAELVTNCNQLKLLASDGKRYKTDVADTEQMFRIIQSVPSPKAEPFKQWMARVAAERLDQMQDPELGIQRAMADYKRLGYSDNWINQRLKSIEIRKDLTDQWRLHNVEEGVQYATLTDIIYQAWAGKTAKDPQNFEENAQCASEGGEVARVAKEQLELKTGRGVVSSLSAKRFFEEQKRVDSGEDD